MKKTREFDNILNECLERILVRGETVESCLLNYPEQAAELELLLETALASKEASVIKPRSEFRQRARHQFHSALQQMEIEKERRTFSWLPQWATAVAAVLIVLLVGGGGTVAAANDSMPDEPLYPVKLSVEAVRLAFTPSAMGKAEMYVQLADERIEEIEAMAAKGKAEQVEQTADRLNNHLVAMAGLVAPQEAAIQKRDSATLQAPALPESATPEVATEVTESATEEAPKVAVEETSQPSMRGAPDTPGAAGRGRGNAGSVKDEDSKADKRTELEVILSRNAVAHGNALQAMLKKAPDSVKDALQQAIIETDSGYQQVLEAID